MNIDTSILEEYLQNRPESKLQAWLVCNIPSEEMVFRDAALAQVRFIRDEAVNMFKDLLNDLTVGSTHMSKSIILPVYRLQLLGGVTLIMRGNFHNWKVSVESSKASLAGLNGNIFTNSEPIHPVYCEGFTADQVFGTFAQDPNKFTAELDTDKDLYTFFFLLKEELKKQSP